MTTKTFCNYCTAYTLADEALWEHVMDCAGCYQGYTRCDLYTDLARLRSDAEAAMTANCPGGRCAS